MKDGIVRRRFLRLRHRILQLARILGMAQGRGVAMAEAQRQSQAFHFLRHLADEFVQPPHQLALRCMAQRLQVGIR